jgi:hypothetical protein
MDKTLIILVVVALVVAGAFAWARFGRSRSSQPQTAHHDADFPPKPKWKPTVPVDIPRTVQTFAHYTDRKRSFAVFTHGTCVLLPDGSKDAEKDAKEILDKVYNYHPDFNPQAMDDGHFIVSYSQPAYSIVFKDELETHRDYIDRNHLDGVVPAEVLLNAKGEANKFDDRGKIGLLGRARMFLDAQTPVVVQIWRP